MTFVSAIVAAAGRGERLKSKTPKPLVRLKNKALLSYSLEKLAAHPDINEIIVAANPANIKQVKVLTAKICKHKFSCVLLGGRRRQDSVSNALKAVNQDADIVLIHDAGRPFLSAQMIREVIAGAKGAGAAVIGVPVKSTLKEIKNQKSKIKNKALVAQSLNRSLIWEIQTPQAFRKDLLEEGFRRFGRAQVTDEAMLVEKMGSPVVVAMGAYKNIKITTPEDILIADAIIKKHG